MDRTPSAPELLLHMNQSNATKLLLDAPSPPTFFHGERVIPDRDYPQSLSEEDCRALVESMLSAEQRQRLMDEETVSFIVEVPGSGKWRVFATRHEGVTSALITA